MTGTLVHSILVTGTLAHNLKDKKPTICAEGKEYFYVYFHVTLRDFQFGMSLFPAAEWVLAVCIHV